MHNYGVDVMKINGTKIKVKINQQKIGVFHTAFIIKDHDKSVIESIIEWLSYNCVDNFIISEHKSAIVAGGSVDNKLAFLNGEFKLGDEHDSEYELETEYEIRLHATDIFAFRLRWLDEGAL